MNKLIKYFSVALFCFTYFIAPCQTTDERVNGWRQDIDELLNLIKKFHYVYQSKPLPKEMVNLAAKLKASVGDYSDERMLIELERLMYYIGDGHSYISPVGARVTKTFCLPMKFYQFSDGIFIIDADPSYQKYIGHKVIQAGPVKSETFIKDMVGYVSQDNTMGAKWIGPYFLRFRGMLEAYGLEKGATKVKFDLQDRNGKKESVEIKFVEFPKERGIPKLIRSQLPAAPTAPLYLENVSDNFWMKLIPGKRAIYIQYNQVANERTETIQAFTERVQKSIMANKTRNLIVDVRHNNGGNGELNEPLVKLLENFETSVSGGRIIVITGRNTFSAAQLFIAQVDKRTKAIFAGEPSSSKPNFVGEEFPVTLPYSGATGSISNRYHENIPGDNRKWIEPEIKVTLSSADYFANRDPVMEEIFKKL